MNDVNDEQNATIAGGVAGNQTIHHETPGVEGGYQPVMVGPLRTGPVPIARESLAEASEAWMRDHNERLSDAFIRGRAVLVDVPQSLLDHPRVVSSAELGDMRSYNELEASLHMSIGRAAQLGLICVVR